MLTFLRTFNVLSEIPKKILLLGVVLFSLPAMAASMDLLLLLPGFPGTSSQAQPYVDKMLRYLEVDLGLEPNSMSGVFVPDGEKVKSKLEQIKPGVALVGPSVYAGNAKKMKMKVVAKVTANGRGEQRFHVVVKRNGIAKIGDLSGAISGVVVHDEKYVYNVLLDGQVAKGKLTMKPNKRPLRALRELVNGKVAATIIDDDVKAHMAKLDFAQELEILYSSKPVPAPAVVVLNDGKKHATAIKNALANLCDKPDGKALCKSLTITSIEPASDADYKSLLNRYNR